MPNLPAQMAQGATAVAIGEHSHTGDERFALEVFRSLGPLVVTVPEALLDAFTAVAGSGPAYLFYLAHAMQDAAVAFGFDSWQAREIVAQTLLGAAMLLSTSDVDSVSLRQSVTSRGGTTQAAIDVFDAHNLHDVIVNAIAAARERGKELSGGS
jgi:pyrroline-5-carboxylate reductase